MLNREINKCPYLEVRKNIKSEKMPHILTKNVVRFNRNPFEFLVTLTLLCKKESHDILHGD
jgi:hypothetical protein